MRSPPLVALVALSVLIAGQPAMAQPAAGAAPDDPFESTNRAVYSGQNGLDHGIFRPIARLYRALTPGPIGAAIHNVLENLSEPVIIANDILQLRLKRAAHDTLRLTANTTAGWLGLMDVAKGGGLPHQDNDFGVTLGRWGVPAGPYLYLPLLGPSTVRDAIGTGVDAAMDPFDYISYPHKTLATISRQAVGVLDERITTQAEEDALLADAADPYATLRSVYLQNRESMVRGESATPALAPIDSGTPPPDAPPSDQSAPPSGPPGASAAPDAGPSAGAAAPVATLADDPDAPIATARDYRPIVAALRAPMPEA